MASTPPAHGDAAQTAAPKTLAGKLAFAAAVPIGIVVTIVVILIGIPIPFTDITVHHFGLAAIAGAVTILAAGTGFCRVLRMLGVRTEAGEPGAAGRVNPYSAEADSRREH